MADDWFSRYPGMRFERRDHGVLWMTLEQAAPAFDASAALEMLSFMGPDAAEGVAAVQETRRPNFGS